MSAGAFSKPRLTQAERIAAAMAMRDLMAAQDLTITEAGVAIGLTKRNAGKIGELLGLRSSPAAIQRAHAKALGTISPEAAKAGREKAAAALAEHRQRMKDEAAARLDRIVALSATMTNAQVAQAMGCSVGAVERALLARGIRKAPGPRGAAWRAEVEARRAQRAEIAEGIRSYVNRHHCTVSEAVRVLQLGEKRGRRIAEEFRVRAPAGAVAQRLAESGRLGRAAKKANQAKRATCINARAAKRAEDAAYRQAPPNPRLTPAQQANVVRGRLAMSAMMARASEHVPPPPNADELIREAIAAGKVTRCPPRFAAAVNNGRGL